MVDLESRITAVEQALQQAFDRIERLDQLDHREQLYRPDRSLSARPSAEAAGFDLWLVDALRERHPSGAVAFGGTVTVGKGEAVWQWGAETETLREADWSSAAGVLDALAHPVRLHLLQRVLNGTVTTADLALDDALGTTGQLHHHLRALVAGGWLQSVGRGTWTIPAPRVVPLLVVVSAGLSR